MTMTKLVVLGTTSLLVFSVQQIVAFVPSVAVGTPVAQLIASDMDYKKATSSLRAILGENGDDLDGNKQERDGQDNNSDDQFSQRLANHIDKEMRQNHSNDGPLTSSRNSGSDGGGFFDEIKKMQTSQNVQKPHLDPAKARARMRNPEAKEKAVPKPHIHPALARQRMRSLKLKQELEKQQQAYQKKNGKPKPTGFKGDKIRRGPLPSAQANTAKTDGNNANGGAVFDENGSAKFKVSQQQEINQSGQEFHNEKPFFVKDSPGIRNGPSPVQGRSSRTSIKVSKQKFHDEKPFFAKDAPGIRDGVSSVQGRSTRDSIPSRDLPVTGKSPEFDNKNGLDQQDLENSGDLSKGTSEALPLDSAAFLDEIKESPVQVKLTQDSISSSDSTVTGKDPELGNKSGFDQQAVANSGEVSKSTSERLPLDSAAFLDEINELNENVQKPHLDPTEARERMKNPYPEENVASKQHLHPAEARARMRNRPPNSGFGQDDFFPWSPDMIPGPQSRRQGNPFQGTSNFPGSFEQREMEQNVMHNRRRRPSGDDEFVNQILRERQQLQMEIAMLKGESESTNQMLKSLGAELEALRFENRGDNGSGRSTFDALRNRARKEKRITQNEYLDYGFDEENFRKTDIVTPEVQESQARRRQNAFDMNGEPLRATTAEILSKKTEQRPQFVNTQHDFVQEPIRVQAQSGTTRMNSEPNFVPEPVTTKMNSGRSTFDTLRERTERQLFAAQQEAYNNQWNGPAPEYNRQWSNDPYPEYESSPSTTAGRSTFDTLRERTEKHMYKAQQEANSNQWNSPSQDYDRQSIGRGQRERYPTQQYENYPNQYGPPQQSSWNGPSQEFHRQSNGRGQRERYPAQQYENYPNQYGPPQQISRQDPYGRNQDYGSGRSTADTLRDRAQRQRYEYGREQDNAGPDQWAGPSQSQRYRSQDPYGYNQKYSDGSSRSTYENIRERARKLLYTAQRGGVPPMRRQDSFDRY